MMNTREIRNPRTGAVLDYAVIAETDNTIILRGPGADLIFDKKTGDSINTRLPLQLVPTSNVTYHTFRENPAPGFVALGSLHCRTRHEAMSIADGWDGVLKMTHEDGKLVSVEFTPA